MIEQFYNPQSIITGIAKIFILIAIGFTVYRTGLLKKESLEFLNTYLFWIGLPALMLDNITAHFTPSAFPGWWMLPLYGILISVAGFWVGYAGILPFKKFSAKREFLVSCAFQNSGYLPIALTVFVCSGDFCSTLLIYIFLFLIGYNLVMWSFGPIFVSRKKVSELSLIHFINPPLVAMVIAFTIVFSLGTGKFPPVLREPIAMLGSTVFPLSVVMLGGYLSAYKGYITNHWQAMAVCVCAKLVILPLAVLLIIRQMDLSIAMKFFLFLESLMPSAVSLVILGNEQYTDNQFLAGAVFYSHLAAIITIPLWLGIFRAVL